MSQNIKYRCIGFVLAMLVFAGGCADKLSYDRFGTLTRGVSVMEDAEFTLGSPNQKIGNQWVWERHPRGLTVWLEFDANGILTSKRWIDAQQNQIEIDDPEMNNSNGNTQSTTLIRTIK